MGFLDGSDFDHPSTKVAQVRLDRILDGCVLRGPHSITTELSTAKDTRSREKVLNRRDRRENPQSSGRSTGPHRVVEAAAEIRGYRLRANALEWNSMTSAKCERK